MTEETNRDCISAEICTLVSDNFDYNLLLNCDSNADGLQNNERLKRRGKYKE